MNDILLNILVIAFSLVVIGGVFWYSWHSKNRREKELRRMAEQRGWVYESFDEDLKKGYQIRSSRWVFEAQSVFTGRELESGSSNMHSNTRWWALDGELPQGTVLIGSRPAGMEHLGENGMRLAQQVLQRFFGNRAAGLAEVQVGSEAFRSRYLVLADEIRQAENLLAPAVERRLLDWPYRFEPLVSATGGELSLEIKSERLDRTEEVLALISLGEALIVS